MKYEYFISYVTWNDKGEEASGNNTCTSRIKINSIESFRSVEKDIRRDFESNVRCVEGFAITNFKLLKRRFW